MPDPITGKMVTVLQGLDDNKVKPLQPTAAETYSCRAEQNIDEDGAQQDDTRSDTHDKSLRVTSSLIIRK